MDDRQLQQRATRAIPALLMLLTGSALAWWSWGTWLDPVIDFGRELYIPWRLSEGQLLYRDLAYFNGPLSPYFNTLMFRLFGAHLLTLVVTNLALLALLTGLLYRLLVRATDTLSATIGSLTLLVVFAFSQYLRCANFNYVTPYSHEMTHGLCLGFAALACFANWLTRRSLAPLACAGFFAGLSALTKAEFCVAILGALAVGAWLDGAAQSRARGGGVPRRRVACAVFVSVAALPLAVTFLLFLAAWNFEGAWQSTFFPWLALLDGSYLQFPFYRQVLGIDHPGENFLTAALALLTYGIVFLAVAWVSIAWGRRRLVDPLPLLVALAALVSGLLLYFRDDLPLRSMAAPLPILLFVAGVRYARTGRRESGEARTQSVAIATLCAFSFLVCLKVILRVPVDHYGFALAMPGSVLLVALLFHELPRQVEMRKGNARLARYLLGGGWCGLAGAFLCTSAAFLALKTDSLGEGRDRFRADARARLEGKALERLQRAFDPNDSMVVMPEGVLLNFLTRRVNPTRHVSFMPYEMALYGEEAMLRELVINPPEVILLVHRHTAEYGVPFYGRDYGKRIMAWVRSRYRPESLIGERPFQRHPSFGVEILRKI